MVRQAPVELGRRHWTVSRKKRALLIVDDLRFLCNWQNKGGVRDQQQLRAIVNDFRSHWSAPSIALTNAEFLMDASYDELLAQTSVGPPFPDVEPLRLQTESQRRDWRTLRPPSSRRLRQTHAC